MKRTQIREQVFKLVFSQQFHEDEDVSEQMKLLLEEGSTIPEEEDLEEDEDEVHISKKAAEEISAKAADIIDKLETIDGRISELSRGWKISRINKVDLSILRLAFYEILFEQLPPKVVVNEAVELAKKYGTDQSGSFINGVLAKLIN